MKNHLHQDNIEMGHSCPSFLDVKDEKYEEDCIFGTLESTLRVLGDPCNHLFKEGLHPPPFTLQKATASLKMAHGLYKRVGRNPLRV